MIESLKFGNVVVNGKNYDNDIVVLPSGEVKPWWRKEGSRAVIEDFHDMLQLKPKRLIVGNGMYRMLGILPPVRVAIEQLGIRFDVYQSEQAVSEFNKLKEDSSTILALHIRD